MADNEQRILDEIRGVRGDVKEVHSRVSSLQHDTGEFKLKVTETLAKIEQIESTCPIKEVELMAREAQTTADDARRESRRVSAIIAAGISSVIAGIGAFFGFGGKG